jgi:hypothetical protein
MSENQGKYMHPKEKFLRDHNNFTGFVVTYNNGKKIYQKENYYSKNLNKRCNTNWAEIEKDKIEILELFWKGESKAKISKAPSEMHEDELSENDWFFSHNGYIDMGTRKIKVISRNIGYKIDKILHIISVIEDSGEIIRKVRAAS